MIDMILRMLIHILFCFEYHWTLMFWTHMNTIWPSCMQSWYINVVRTLGFLYIPTCWKFAWLNCLAKSGRNKFRIKLNYFKLSFCPKISSDVIIYTNITIKQWMYQALENIFEMSSHVVALTKLYFQIKPMKIGIIIS